MSKSFFIACLLFFTFNVFSQDVEEGNESLNWLKKHLNYSYFNAEQEKWWINKFEYNEKGIVHFQNLSTDNPRKFSGRSWIDRRVRWIHLDPYSIVISPITENRGRVVKGSVLQIDVINNERKIQKTLDGKPASPENFIQIAIPRSIEDTARTFSDSLKYHLIAAIELNSKITPQGEDEDISQVFDVLRGTFSAGAITRTFSQEFPAKLSYVSKSGEKPIDSGFFGYSDRDGFFEVMMSEKNLRVIKYDLNRDQKLVLVERDGGNRRISLSSIHHFEIQDVGGSSLQFTRLSY